MASPIPQHLNHASTSSLQSTPRASRSRMSPQSSPQHGSPRSSSPRAGSSLPMDAEGVIRNNGGDVRKALDAVITERNNLQSQNSQLWNLIGKQRSSTAQLIADNERLRIDRERANKILMNAGLEPLNGKRIPNSSSAVGLGLKPEPPQIRRHNSDRDEKITAPTASSSLDIPKERNSSAPSSPLQQENGLLPSAMPESRLRRESRMTFAPEVTSFMSLADSPREMEHNIPPLPIPMASPASSASPNHQMPTKQDPSQVPPPSSRPLAVMTEISEEASMPREAPPRKSSMKSPVQSQFRDRPMDARFAEEPPRLSQEAQRTSEDQSTPRQAMHSERQSQDTARPPRPLPRLAPALLPHTRLSIPHSTIYPNASGRDVLCFVVSVTIRPPNAQPVSWSVAKLFSAFIDLDNRVKARSGKSRKDLKAMLAPLPDAKVWKDFAPSKVDQRKTALEAYLQSLLIAPLSDKSDLCDFLSTDPVQARANTMRKEGYLTKKGKNFGGWKTRYFVLEGPVMDYYETRGGTHLGSITITGAQIGRQNRPNDSGDERDFRHAFLILEAPKRGGRHVLCAESDIERDSWIDMLVKHVDSESPPPPQIHNPAPIPNQTQSQLPPSTSAPVVPPRQRQRSDSKRSGIDVVVTAAQPMANMLGAQSSDSKFSGAPSPSMINSMESKRSTQPPPPTSNSAPTLQASNAKMMDARPNQPVTFVTSPSVDIAPSSSPIEGMPKPTKRQSMMPTRSSHSSSQPAHTAAYLSKLSQDGLSAPPNYLEKDRDRKAKSGRFWPSFGKAPEKPTNTRPVFGVPLVESLAVASVANLPAIVFRCIEWLEAKHAEQEEGIYRLSGSSAVIKGLKDRFDLEGDVNLKQVNEHWDPHAIAGLLKSFLRDLPTSLLTRDLHPRFLAVMDLVEPAARINELCRLVSDLPPPNYALLRALTAHLILIVKHSAINKMTLRNIGIVFSPTLGIPAGIFSDLVSHFGAIFDDEPMDLPDNGIVPQDGEQEGGGRKRNSMLYAQGGADTMLGLAGRSLDPPAEDSTSEISGEGEDSSGLEEETESNFLSAPSSENLSHTAAHSNPSTPSMPGPPSSNIGVHSNGSNSSHSHDVFNPQSPLARPAKAAARAAERGLVVDTPRGHVADETIRSPRKGSGGSNGG